VLALAMTQSANADGVDRTYQLVAQAGTIAIDPIDGRVYVATSGASMGFLTVIEPTSGQTTVHVTSGTANVLALDSVHRRLYVANYSYTVDVFDLTTMAIVATLPVYAVGLAVDSNTQRVYAVGGSGLTVIDGTTNTVIASRPGLAGENWSAVAVDSSLHRVYVTNSFNWPPDDVFPSLIALDDRDLSIISELLLPVTPRWGLAVDEQRHRVYVAGGGVSATNGYLPQLVSYDGASLARLASADMPALGDPAAIAVGADKIYVTSFFNGYTVFDAETLAVTQSVSTVPLRPFWPALDAQGRLYLGIVSDNGAPDAVVRVSPGNHAPQVTASFSPSAPTTNNVLSFDTVALDGDFGDLPDGQRDPVTLVYEWELNGVPTSQTGSTVDLSRPGAGDRGDTISARVTATDPEGLTAQATASVLIANAPPTVTVTLSSATPGTNDTLTATTTASDADGDPVTLTYEWLRNGTPIPGATTTSLDLATQGDQGDVIFVRVTAIDDHGGIRVAAARALVIPVSGSFLYMKSQPGDYILSGGEALYMQPATTVWGSSAASSRYFSGRFLQGTAHQWSVELVAPTGQALAVGSYTGAVRAAISTTTPGLQVTGDGRGCNTLTGQFTVTELSFSSSGVLLVLDATFEQHCEGAAPALVGRIRYEDDLTPGVTLPTGVIPVPTSGQFVYLNNTRGSELLFTSADSTFAPWEKLFEGGNVFRVFAVKGNYVRTASIQIGAAPGQPLAVGQYVRAVAGLPPAGIPHLDVTADSASCGQNIGRFDVEELSFAPTGELTVFQATFEQRCVNTINVLFGRVRIENPYHAGVTLPAGTVTVPTTGNFLYLKGEPTVYVGLGMEQLYTSANATFTRSLTGLDSFSLLVVQGSVHRLNVNLAAPAGQSLAVGSYVRAFRAAFRPAGSPGMDIYGDGQGCNTILGKFDVDEVAYWSNGDVRAFQATFEQHCEGGLPALFGRVRFETQQPLEVSVAIRSDGTVSSRTTLATISGTVTCSRNAPLQIRFTLTQTQGKIDVTGTVLIDLECVAPSVPWSVSVSPSSGRFKSGSGVATVDAVLCEAGCITSAPTATVKLSPIK
jgi:hypothetical protein